MLSRVSIKFKVLIAPLAVMLLFMGLSGGAIWLLRSQGGPAPAQHQPA